MEQDVTFHVHKTIVNTFFICFAVAKVWLWPFLPLILKHFGLKASQIGVICASQVAVGALCTPLWLSITRATRYSKKVQAIIATTLVLLIVSYMCVSFLPSAGVHDVTHCSLKSSKNQRETSVVQLATNAINWNTSPGKNAEQVKESQELFSTTGYVSSATSQQVASHTDANDSATSQEFNFTTLDNQSSLDVTTTGFVDYTTLFPKTATASDSAEIDGKISSRRFTEHFDVKSSEKSAYSEQFTKPDSIDAIQPVTSPAHKFIPRLPHRDFSGKLLRLPPTTLGGDFPAVSGQSWESVSEMDRDKVEETYKQLYAILHGFASTGGEGEGRETNEWSEMNRATSLSGDHHTSDHSVPSWDSSPHGYHERNAHKIESGARVHDRLQKRNSGNNDLTLDGLTENLDDLELAGRDKAEASSSRAPILESFSVDDKKHWYFWGMLETDHRQMLFYSALLLIMIAEVFGGAVIRMVEVLWYFYLDDMDSLEIFGENRVRSLGISSFACVSLGLLVANLDCYLRFGSNKHQILVHIYAFAAALVVACVLSLMLPLPGSKHCFHLTNKSKKLWKVFFGTCSNGLWSLSIFMTGICMAGSGVFLFWHVDELPGSTNYEFVYVSYVAVTLGAEALVFRFDRWLPRLSSGAVLVVALQLRFVFLGTASLVTVAWAFPILGLLQGMADALTWSAVERHLGREEVTPWSKHWVDSLWALGYAVGSMSAGFTLQQWGFPIVLIASALLAFLWSAVFFIVQR